MTKEKSRNDNLIWLIMDAYEKSNTREGYEKFSMLHERYMQLAEDTLLSKGYTSVSWPGIYPMVTDKEGRTYTISVDDCERFLGKVDAQQVCAAKEAALQIIEANQC